MHRLANVGLSLSLIGGLDLPVWEYNSSMGYISIALHNATVATVTQRSSFPFIEPAIFLTPSKFVKMATKRKFVSENSGALVPVKKPKQHEVALANQGGAIQAVCTNIFSFFG